MRDNVIRVQIFGDNYTLRATEDPLYIQKVAQYVDEKFYEIAKGSPTLPTARMAVLASLNIADEFLKRVEEKGQETTELSARLGALVDLINAQLQGLPGEQRTPPSAE